MKKPIVYVGLVVTLICLAVYFLYTRNHQLNGFARKFMPNHLQLLKVMRLPDQSFSFAGKLDTQIILNRYSDRLNIYKTSYDLDQLDTIKITYTDAFKSDARNIYKDYASPYIYCSNPYGDLSIFDGKQSMSHHINNFRFDYLQAISPEAVIVRARFPHKEQTNRSIAKLALAGKGTRIVKEYALPDVANGIFANDGMLLFDKESEKVFYMYYYIGEFLCLDMDLNLQYHAKTIDTVRTAFIKTRLSLEKSKDHKQLNKRLIKTSPPIFISAYITTHKGCVYITSMLKSDHEAQSDFRGNQTIDVYDIKNGGYQYSFYISKYKGENVRQFQIRGNHLVALHKNYLISYQFSDVEN